MMRESKRRIKEMKNHSIEINTTANDDRNIVLLMMNKKEWNWNWNWNDEDLLNDSKQNDEKKWSNYHQDKWSSVDCLVMES